MASPVASADYPVASPVASVDYPVGSPVDSGDYPVAYPVAFAADPTIVWPFDRPCSELYRDLLASPVASAKKLATSWPPLHVAADPEATWSPQSPLHHLAASNSRPRQVDAALITFLEKEQRTHILLNTYGRILSMQS